jgi:hypothetical protein
MVSSSPEPKTGNRHNGFFNTRGGASAKIFMLIRVCKAARRIHVEVLLTDNITMGSHYEDKLP